MADSTARPLLGIGAILAALLATGPAGAQEPVPQCDGKDATIVFENWTEADFTATQEVTVENADGTVDGQTTLSLAGLGGTEGDDVIVIGPPSPDFTNAWGNVLGLGGHDTICVSNQLAFIDDFRHLYVLGGAGNDTIFNMDNTHLRQVSILGNGGDDVLHGSKRTVATDTLDDQLWIGSDILDGGAGNDTIYGYQGYNAMWGGSGDDTIRGGSDFDAVGGGSGDDTIYGAQGLDRLYGGPGKDTIFGGAGNDVIASNDDFIGFHQSFLDETPPGQFNLSTPSFSQDTAGSRMFGGAGSDMIIGSNRWDRMQGGAGDDVLLGMEGRDWMRGGAGNDILIGGAGIDDMIGNLGFDSIILQGADIGHGGYGQDTCYTVLNSAGASFGLCERSGDTNTQWPAIAEQINELLDSGDTSTLSEIANFVD